MCGIGGFVGDFNPGLLEEMSQALAHRGPDDAGVFYDPSVRLGLSHRRLSIIDLSPMGKQPMWDVTHRALITYNGEIYNYPELRRELIEDGFEFKSHSDTECLLNLYIRDGADMVTRLNGIFAFALWDDENKELFVVRDGVGIKPLYYSETQNGFIFASEIKAILREKTVERVVDAGALHHYLTYSWCPAPLSPIRSIKKLEPGYAMMVRDGKVTSHWQFYDLPYNNGTNAIEEREAIQLVYRSTQRAVSRQMIADVPVGAFLSGGLDSSAVALFAQQALPERKLQCFTIGFTGEGTSRDGQAEDLPYARRVADKLGVDLHVVYVGAEIVGELENMVYHLDEPQSDPAAINALLICRLAKEHNIKVLLSGAGGDDIFGGYRRHHALLSEKYWSWLPRRLRRGVRVAAASLPKKSTLSRRVSKALSYADLEDDARLVSYFYWQ
ncbi:MAG: asparagine synthase (glutamine-hydrolyzing), partial [Candidatus Krumholzibacteria bacterium]|nr:asparagine synthase (glutamine-hydrolyzing) [Candidatus Krumholzibacteria bacterium]